MVELWTDIQASSQEMGLAASWSLIDLEDLKSDRFSQVVKNLFSNTLV